MKRNFSKTLYLLAIIFLFSFNPSFVIAQDDLDEYGNKLYSINLDAPTIAKGYTVSAFNNNLKLSLVPGILSEQTGVDVVEIAEEMETPWQLEKISEVYQFEFRNKGAYDNHKPFYIQFSYDQKTNFYKKVYFYDKNYQSWRPLPTVDFPDEGFVRSLIHLPFARIAVFSDKEYMTVGQASWYAYKGGNFAASPDFSKGSRLRVYNLENNKFVDVEINDYGPDRKIHPERVIDLDKVAFLKLADLGQGIINVKIEPIDFNVAGKIAINASAGLSSDLSLKFKAGIVVNEDNLEVIWQKNATTTLPLASLSKLVAINVFLNTNTSMDSQIAYKISDEEHNYKYCEKWESARVRLGEGDIVTVEDLIYSSLVGSANNAVETLVRASGLERDQFIRNMNDLVVSWGCKNTKFFEPTGLSPENVSTVSDYVIITKEVYKNPIIQKASLAKTYSFSTINTNKKYNLKNTNQLLLSDNAYQITGSKTGYLHEALYCLMLRATNQKGENLIAVVLGNPDRQGSFNEADILLDYGFIKL